MERNIILKWLSGYGYGGGYGCGDGFGDGFGYSCYDGGDGNGDGNGYGAGSGQGKGDGYGSSIGYCRGNDFGDDISDGNGNGYGNGDDGKIIKHKSYDVFYIDCMPTIITVIIGNYAKGFTIGQDYQLTPCYIAKSENGNLFAHGSTLEEAMEDLQEKISNAMTDEEKIELFCQTFKKGEKYKGTEFFKWHSILTGSCLFGKNEFVKKHNLNVEDLYTVNEFISICENDYGGDIIKELKKYY